MSTKKYPSNNLKLFSSEVTFKMSFLCLIKYFITLLLVQRALAQESYLESLVVDFSNEVGVDFEKVNFVAKHFFEVPTFNFIIFE